MASAEVSCQLGKAHQQCLSAQGHTVPRCHFEMCTSALQLILSFSCRFVTSSSPAWVSGTSFCSKCGWEGIWWLEELGAWPCLTRAFEWTEVRCRTVIRYVWVQMGTRVISSGWYLEHVDICALRPSGWELAEGSVCTWHLQWGKFNLWSPWFCSTLELEGFFLHLHVDISSETLM